MVRPAHASLLIAVLAFPFVAAHDAQSALAALTVKFISMPSIVRLGAPARVEVATVSGAICDIEVRSPGGLVRTAGIRPKKALDSGRIIWLWRVGKSMRPGTWTVAVDCLLGEQVGRTEARFTVK
ncbi:MAG TPA: hypothetical protein VI007_05055 [bacterium]